MMQPAEPIDHLPRRGFFRRRWMALGMLGVLVSSGFITFACRGTVKSSRPMGFTMFIFRWEQGYLISGYRDTDSAYHMLRPPRWTVPHFGGWPQMLEPSRMPGGTGVALPLWVPLLFVVVWIGWSERRVHRPAQRRECPETESEVLPMQQV